MGTAKNLVRLEDIRKSFHQNTVLDGVSLELNESEIVSIIGGNGAGKSTLMKILTGIYSADSGTVEIDGEKAAHLNPKAAHERGIYLVPQEPLLFPNMTIEQNLTIGMDKKKKEIKEEAINIIGDLGWTIDMKRMASTLSIAEQQQLEIIKGILRKSKVLILDEPTSTLTFSETESLFKVIHRLKETGVGIFYITHRLDEVFRISTHAVILRDGKVTLKGKVEDFTKEMFIEGMLPESTGSQYEQLSIRRTASSNRETPVLQVENISGDGFRNISFEVYEGEVVGLAGLVGAGRTEIAEAVYGLNRTAGGKIRLNGIDITHSTINDSASNGLALIPEDRFLHGIFPIASVRDNMTVQLTKKHGFFIRKKSEERLARQLISKLRIKAESPDDEIKSLSGGNQQKAVIARILSMNPKLIIMDEPTRGIDVASRGDIYTIIDELKNEGVSVLLISSDLEEIERISDRIYAVYQGTCQVCLGPDEINAGNVMKAAFGTYEGVEK